MTKKTKILLIGPIPPPFGGVSVHISRLKNILEEKFWFDVIDESRNEKDFIYNIRSFNVITYLSKISRSELVYIHSGLTILRYLNIIIAKIFQKKIILTLHSYPVRKKKVFRLLDEIIFNLSNKIIVVNAVFLKRIKISSSIIIKEAFIPPILTKEQRLNSAIESFIKNKKNSGYKLIVANAWQLQLFNNVDLYGLDLCLSSAKILASNNLNVCFIFIVSSKGKNSYLFDKYQKQIIDENLSDNFILLHEKLSFVRLIQAADIVVRPTNTDGDALTIRESLYLNKPIIASDVVVRPEGTILFNNRNADDFAEKIKNTIENYEYIVSNLKEVNNNNDYTAFYANLLSQI